MPKKHEQEEYPAFRYELVAIVAARYTILGLAIAGLGIMTSIIFPRAPTTSIAGAPFAVELLLPYLYTTILIPSMLITFLLTVHYRRIDAYLWARYESEDEPAFQTAYDRFRLRGKFHPAYTTPLTLTYAMLSTFAILVSLYANWKVVVHQQAYWGWPVGGMSVLLLIVFVFLVLMSNYAQRPLTRRYRIQWTQTLDFIKDHAHSKRRGAIFLDRDGVINQNREAGVTSRSQFEFIKGTERALAKLTENEFVLVIVTNQPYVGNNKMTEDDLNTIHRYMQDQIWKSGGYIRRIYTCTHSEGSQCSCRKPGTQLFWQASRELNIDLSNSWVIGDQMSDIEAGKKIGARTILVRTGEGEKTRAELKNYAQEMQPSKIVHDIVEAADIILREVRLLPGWAK